MPQMDWKQQSGPSDKALEQLTTYLVFVFDRMHFLKKCMDERSRYVL